MDSLSIDELDEILDQLYRKIHHFLIQKVGDDLNHKLIDISLETTENGELTVNIDLSLELSPFSKFKAQEIADEAVKYGIKEADQIFPSLIINLKPKVSQ